MRIVIVGAGISGLASYLFLKKYLPLSVQTGSGFEIIILENHRATKRVARSEPSANEGSGRVSNIIGAALGLGTKEFRVDKVCLLIEVRSAKKPPTDSL